MKPLRLERLTGALRRKTSLEGMLVVTGISLAREALLQSATGIIREVSVVGDRL